MFDDSELGFLQIHGWETVLAIRPFSALAQIKHKKHNFFLLFLFIWLVDFFVLFWFCLTTFYLFLFLGHYR